MKPKTTSLLTIIAPRLRSSVMVCVSLCVAAIAQAESDVWSSTAATGAWETAANWVKGVAAPGSTSGTASPDTAIFNTTSTNQAITVDAGRNIMGITFGVNSTYTLQGNTLLLTSGGTILSNGSAGDERISAPLQIQGDGGTYTIQADTPGTNREIIISGGITGVATSGNTTTLTLTGASTGANEIGTVGISDGIAGGNLALVKDGASLWVFGTPSSYTGGTTIKAGTLRLSNSGNTTGIIGAGTLTFEGTGTLRLQSTTSTTVNNDVVVNGTGGAVSVRTNDNFNPASLTGTGTITLTGDNALTITTTDLKDFGGTISVVATPAGTFNLRLGSGYLESSMQNAVLDLQAGANLNHQAGTNGTFTTQIGTLSGAAGSFVGGSAPGGGTVVFSVGSRDENSTFSGVIGDGGTKSALTKVGTGTLTLEGINTYTGNTTISAGTLSITNAYLANTSTISIADGGAKMKLDFAGNDTIAELELVGLGLMGPGTYNATTHPDYFDAAGTGSLVVSAGGSAYETWATDNGLTLGVNDGTTDDPENDGIENALEFVLGGDPLVSDTDILPDLTVDATNFIFTFTREDDSEAEVTLKFQHGSNLTGWTDVVIGADTASSGSEVVVTENADAPDTITVTVPKGANTKLFGRIQAVK